MNSNNRSSKMEQAVLKKLEENAAELAKWTEALKRAAPGPKCRGRY
jgi:hypothetical protein